jgi:hypothetical protein
VNEIFQETKPVADAGGAYAQIRLRKPHAREALLSPVKPDPEDSSKTSRAWLLSREAGLTYFYYLVAAIFSARIVEIRLERALFFTSKVNRPPLTSTSTVPPESTLFPIIIDATGLRILS